MEQESVLTAPFILNWRWEACPGPMDQGMYRAHPGNNSGIFLESTREGHDHGTARAGGNDAASLNNWRVGTRR